MECSGVTIFDLESAAPVCVTSIKTKQKETHGKRLKYIEEQLQLLIEKYPPSKVAIERGFSRFNTSTQVIYRVHGVVNKLFHNYEQIYYPPKTVKESIAKGNSSKLVIRKTIEKRYPIINFNNEDESDSFAVAMTYLIKNGLIVWNKGLNLKSTRKKKELKA